MSDPNRQRILICDDDELIVSSLRGLFLLETDYELLEFTSSGEAAPTAISKMRDWKKHLRS